MSLVFIYQDRHETFTVNLGTAAVRLGQVALTSSAQMGDITSSTLVIDDPSGNVGHAGDQILAYHHLYVYETDAPAGNQYIYYGFTGTRQYKVDLSLITGPAVRITTTLLGLNWAAGVRVINDPTGNRPAESVGDRVAWLIASSYSYFADNGLVVYPTKMMDANDYRNQTSANVLDDCAEAVGYDWFIYQDETLGHSLFFDDPNTSTAYTSTLRLTTVLADVDSTVNGGDGATHTWICDSAELTRDPATLASRVIIPWAKGTVSVHRTATDDIYGPIDITATDSNLKTASTATSRANRILWESRNDDDSIDVTFRVPRANVNDLREGQRFEAKFRELPGYKDTYHWFRVLERTVKQEELTDEFYTIDAHLSPQETPQPAGAIVQFAYGAAGSVTMPNNVTVGNILVYAILRMPIGGPSAPQSGIEPSLGGLGSWSQINSFVETTNVGTVQRWTAAIYAKVATGTQPISVNFTGGAVPCCIWEVASSGSTLTGATVLSADVPGAAAVMDIGSFGSPAANLVALMVIGQFTPDGTNIGLAPSTGWTTDDENVRRDYGHPRPWWFGHAITTGAALEAEVVSSVSYDWCGLAVLLPAP